MAPAIDVHVHWGPRWDDVRNVRAGIEDLSLANLRADVARSVATSAESLLSKTALGESDDTHMERRLFAGNEALRAQCRVSRDLQMMVVVDPTLEPSLEQAREMLGDPAVVGVKLHPDRHRYRGGEHAGAVLELLAERPGKVMLMHCTATAYSDPAPVIDLACSHRSVPVVLAHLGRTDPPDLVIGLIRARRSENVYVDTSAIRDPTMVCRAIVAIGAERVLFGSDFPFYQPGDIAALIRSSGASDRDLERIFELNAAELLGAAPW